MRCFISCCLIAILLINTPVNARAAVPLPAVAGGVLAVSLATGVYIYTRGTPSTITSQVVSTASDAAWYSRGAATVGLSLITKGVRLVLPTDSVISRANADPSKYPLLSSHATTKTAPLSASGSSMAVGTIYEGKTGGFYRISSATAYLDVESYQAVSGDGNCITYVVAPNGGTSQSCKAWLSHYWSVPNANGKYFVYRQGIEPATTAQINGLPSGPATPSKFAQTVNSAPDKSALQAEIDKMLRDPSYVPEFTDDTTGLPWAPPADVVRPEKWTEIDERTKAITAAQSAVDAARTAVNELQNRHNTAVAAANADPTNPEKQRELSDIAIALGTAQARLAELEQQLATLIADAEADTNDPDPPVDPGDVPTLKSINWSYGTKLLGSLETAWPFNLLLSLRGMLSPLEASPVAPSFSLPIWGGNNISLSLSVFDPVALVLRWALSLLLTVGAVMAVVRWYRGGN